VDIFLDLVILGFFLIFLIMLVAAFGFEKRLWGTGSRIFSILGFVILLGLILNNYFGNETVVGTVSEINKTSSDLKITSEISEDPRITIENTQGILKAYQVAVYIEEEKKLRIYNNNNSIWRFKFNKDEIQLHLEKGRKYKLRLHKLVFRKNILDIEEL